MPEHFCFYLGLSMLAVHEMDAIRCQEWRILPPTSRFDDKWGYRVFLFAHVPLLFGVFWQLTRSANPEGFITGFNIFLMIHVGLHALLLKHPQNEFKDWVSWSLIITAGLLGMADLLV